MDRAVVVGMFIAAIRGMQDALQARGIHVELTPPNGEEGQPSSVRLDASSARALAQAVIRTSGDLDLIIGDAHTGEILLDEHRQIESETDIAEALRTIEAYLADAQGL